LRDLDAQLTEAIPQRYKWFLSNISNGADLGSLTPSSWRSQNLDTRQ
jgi:hypothetical protein